MHKLKHKGLFLYLSSKEFCYFGPDQTNLEYDLNQTQKCIGI